MNTTSALCPSAPYYEGSQLLGVVNERGGVTLVNEPMPLTPAFAKSAAEVGPPEERFRFVNRCLQKGCQQWSDGACGVIKRVLDRMPTPESVASLPQCAIRPQCRWFGQEGADACKVCPEVTYFEYESAPQAA